MCQILDLPSRKAPLSPYTCDSLEAMFRFYFFFCFDIYILCPLNTGIWTQHKCVFKFLVLTLSVPFLYGKHKVSLVESSLSQEVMGELHYVGHIELAVIRRPEIPKCVMQKCCPLSLLNISNGFLFFFHLPPTLVLPQDELHLEEIDRGDLNSQLSLEQGNYTWKEFFNRHTN